MTSKRASRVPRPPKKDEWALFHLSRATADNWEELCHQQSGVLADLYDRLTHDPRHVDNPARHGRLKGQLGHVTVKGEVLEQWQYEIAHGGRIWYAINDSRRQVWITNAATRHPNQTK